MTFLLLHIDHPRAPGIGWRVVFRSRFAFLVRLRLLPSDVQLEIACIATRCAINSQHGDPSRIDWAAGRITRVAAGEARKLTGGAS